MKDQLNILLDQYIADLAPLMEKLAKIKNTIDNDINKEMKLRNKIEENTEDLKEIEAEIAELKRSFSNEALKLFN
jgi:predicted  nucleic acid-binding Zn-ribbon protein